MKYISFNYYCNYRGIDCETQQTKKECKQLRGAEPDEPAAEYSKTAGADGTEKTGTFGTVKHSQQGYGNRQTHRRKRSELYHSGFHYLLKECIYEYSGCLV